MKEQRKGRVHLTKEDKEDLMEWFKQSYSKYKGHIGNLCEKANISRRTYYKLKEEFPQFGEEMDDIKFCLNDEFIDKAEKTIERLALGVAHETASGKFLGWKVLPDKTALFKLLAIRGAHRGYGGININEVKVEEKKKKKVKTKEQKEEEVKRSRQIALDFSKKQTDPYNEI